MKAGEALAAARNVQVTGELLEANRTALGLTEERVRTGAIPPLEGSLMQVEVNRLDASHQVLESRLEVLRLQLKALAGLSQTRRWRSGTSWWARMCRWTETSA